MPNTTTGRMARANAAGQDAHEAVAQHRTVVQRVSRAVVKLSKTATNAAHKGRRYILVQQAAFALVLLGGLMGARTPAAEPIRVQSRVFDLEYAVPDAAQPLDSVQLWYTLDEGSTWHQYGFDEDRQSPFAFHAPAEGAYGFYLVLSNAAGASSAPPAPSTQPHLRALVDYTPPVVQLHAPRQSSSLGQRVLQIRWTAIDAHLTPRPIEIGYQLPGGEAWFPVTLDPIANTGRYDWRLPDDLVGAVDLRMSVTDRGGHHMESAIQTVELSPETPATSPVAPAGVAGASPSAPSVEPLSEAARLRAARLLAEAVTHRERGDYRQGISRLREAVQIDPMFTDAFAEMGGMLSHVGDVDRALGAYDIALAQRPDLRAALAGVAAIQTQQKDYAAAAERWRTVLRYNPNDAEAWLKLGDLGVYQGDEVLARDCYTRAARIEPPAVRVAEEARQRLSLMAEASRGR